MATGVEVVLVPAISKTAATGAARAAGWAAREALVERRRRKIRALSAGKSGLARRRALESLTDEQSEQLRAFCESAELEHSATSLSRIYLLEGSGKKADKLLAAVKAEFLSTSALWMPDGLADEVREALFAVLVEVVAANANRVLAKQDLSASMQAELIATLGSLSAAAMRNTELLSTLKELDAFLRFETDYRTQAAALHGSMRLPHAGTTRQVPYEMLFVEPRISGSPHPSVG